MYVCHDHFMRQSKIILKGSESSLPFNSGKVDKVDDVDEEDSDSEQKPQVCVCSDHSVFGLSQWGEEEERRDHVVDHNFHPTELLVT